MHSHLRSPSSITKCFLSVNCRILNEGATTLSTELCSSDWNTTPALAVTIREGQSVQKQKKEKIARATIEREAQCRPLAAFQRAIFQVSVTASIQGLIRSGYVKSVHLSQCHICWQAVALQGLRQTPLWDLKCFDGRCWGLIKSMTNISYSLPLVRNPISSCLG